MIYLLEMGIIHGYVGLEGFHQFTVAKPSNVPRRLDPSCDISNLEISTPPTWMDLGLVAEYRQ